MQLPLGTKRAVFLSGMSGAEVQEVISAYNDSGGAAPSACTLVVKISSFSLHMLHKLISSGLLLQEVLPCTHA